MSGVKFKSIFEGKQDIFEEKVMVDSGLLSKLETCGIITNDQRITIEVTYATVLQVLT